MTSARCAVLFALLTGAVVNIASGASTVTAAEARDPAKTAEAAIQVALDREDIAAMLAGIEALRKSVQTELHDARRFCKLARAEYGLESLFEQKSDTASAERWLQRALADTAQALALDEHSADAHTLLADLYGTKIGLEGVWAAIRYGSRADAEAKIALRLEPDNPRVQLTIGRRYLYSPRMFGGDVALAVATFRRAVELAPESSEARRWLATALIKQGDRTGAAAVLDEALRLNPRNAATQRLRAQLP